MTQFSYQICHIKMYLKNVDKYPNLRQIVSMLLKMTPDGIVDTCQLLFQIKYAYMRTGMTEEYNNYRKQSKNQIILMNLKQNFKQYEFRAGASEEQYQNVLKTCKLMKGANKVEKKYKLDVKLNRDQKITWEFKTGKWEIISKRQSFYRQFNIIADTKQFRVNYTQVRQVGQIEKNEQKGNLFFEDNVKETINQLKQSTCIRFKQSIIIDISPYYYIVQSKIYESSEDDPTLQDYRKQIVKIFEEGNVEKTDDYILYQLTKNKRSKVKYEIELRMNNNGMNQIIRLKKQPRNLNRFIGDAIMDLRRLSQTGEKQMSKHQLQIKKLEQQLEDLNLD